MARYIDYSKIPMGKNDIGAKTIGEYFEKLLLTLWDEQEDFSGKRPFGNGGWEYDVYAALISAGVVDGSLDEEGYVVDVTYSAANNIICEMIKQIFNAPTADVVPRAELDAMRSAANSYKMHYEKAKQEADRLAVELEAEKALREVRIERIFEEIYKTMNSVYASVQHSCVGMHGDNPETMRLLGKLDGIKHLGDEISELKKKYVGGDGDE